MLNDIRSVGFSDVPARDGAPSIGFVGYWRGTDLLARLLSTTYRLAAVVDMTGRYVGKKVFQQAPVICASQALNDPNLCEVTWIGHRDHLMPKGLPVLGYSFSDGGNEVIRQRLAELDIVTLHRLSRQELENGYGELSHFFVDWILGRYNCYLPATAEIGDNVDFAYGGVGCVVHAKAVIGNNVKIGQNVTIGGRVRVGPPVVGDNVHIAAGARCVGGKIGSNVVVGANSVVLDEVPDNCVVAGVPARVISTNMENYVGYFKHVR